MAASNEGSATTNGSSGLDNANGTASGWTPVVGAPGWLMRTLSTQHAGIEIMHVSEDKDGTPRYGAPVVLPPLVATYQRGNGVLYRFLTPWGTPLTATAHDVRKGDAWDSMQYSVPRRAHEAAAFAVQQAAREMKPAKVSPRYRQGLPPLAPEGLVPETEDPERGRAGWAWVAGRLAPAGRLTVAMAGASPMMREIAGNSMLWSLTGEGSQGKTLCARIGAALYGANDDGDDGLVRTFNTAGQGLSSWLHTLSYLPPVLDEIQSSGGDVAQQMISLVTGASRSRALRTGEAAPQTGRWEGVLIATGNTPIRDLFGERQHEMFDRRLVEVEAVGLFQPRPTEQAEADEWWDTIYSALPLMQGWPWLAFQQQYPPTPDGAEAWKDRVKRLPLPPASGEKERTIARVLRVGYAYAEWLAEWTGNPAWVEGLWDECARLVAEVGEYALDPARDAGRAVVEHRVTRSGWTDDDRERVAYPVKHYDSCTVSHPDECEWWDLPARVFPEIVGIAPARLSRTAFRLAVSATRPTRLTRPEQIEGRGRVEVYRLCLPACSALGWPETGDNEAPEPPPAPIAPEQLHLPEPTDTPTPAPEPEPVAAPTDSPAQAQAERPVYGHVTTDDVEAGLASAAASGVTDLSVPQSWSPARVEAAGWDTHGWQGLGEAAARVTYNGTTLRVRRADDPPASSAVLSDWLDLTGRPVETSVARLGVTLLREHGASANGHTPRWMLPDDVAALWPGAEVAQTRTWGKPSPGDAKWDRNLSYLPAFTQARLAPLWHGEQFERYDAGSAPEPSGKVSGMWRIVVPDWPWPDLPSPVATIDAGKELWITTERMRLYHSRGIRPQVIEAVLAPAHKIAAMEDWTAQVKTWLADAQDRPARSVAKGLYQTLAGRIGAQWAQGKRYDVYRPDWAWHIIDNSWTSTLRRVYQVHEQTGLAPTSVYVDAVSYPGDEPPEGLPVGTGLGQFKYEGTVTA